MVPAPEPLQLTTLAGCRLRIGRYPTFHYDGRGGGGPGQHDRRDGRVWFTADQLAIPPLDWRSTRFLGLPLPPGLQIAIVAEQLDGHWDAQNGRLDLRFSARFRFRIGPDRAPLYRAPDLRIACTLSGVAAPGDELLLVGIAPVAPSGDAWLDRFLGLPDQARAELRCRVAATADRG